MDKLATILIVDDEVDILELLKYNLEKEGYKVKTAKNGEAAIKKAKEHKPELILLDIMMPEMNGIEVCEALRTNSDLDKTLIAFLTARSESFTQISALDAGGDDFINKPIKPKVLKSRIKALLRRHPNQSSNNSESVLVLGDLEIDFEKIKVRKEETDIFLAKKEFELLRLLVSKPGKVFKRLEILNTVWGSDVIVGDRTIDVHIRKLREKLGSSYIKTIKGIGYKFDF
jgi:two-component system alkaline phosphatase synthesis response regulator PhoP